jgi:hypothetical protein
MPSKRQSPTVEVAVSRHSPSSAAAAPAAQCHYRAGMFRRAMAELEECERRLATKTTTTVALTGMLFGHLSSFSEAFFMRKAV